MDDLWYAWLFCRLHTWIAEHVIEPYRPALVVDAGCGTGFQSFLHAFAGAQVIGFDIAEGMVRHAAVKARTAPRERWPMLFLSPYGFVHEHRLSLAARLGGRSVARPRFFTADVRDVPLETGVADHVNCCGTVLSLCADHNGALAEFARILKPGGTLCLEVLNRWSFETLWPVLAPAYELPLREALRPFREPYCSRAYGSEERPDYLRARLFTKRSLAHDLRRNGFEPVRWGAIHTWTNLLPSVWTSRSEPAFRFLAALEVRAPHVLPGASLVVLAQRR